MQKSKKKQQYAFEKTKLKCLVRAEILADIINAWSLLKRPSLISVFSNCLAITTGDIL